jgi:hypothetical protein
VVLAVLRGMILRMVPTFAAWKPRWPLDPPVAPAGGLVLARGGFCANGNAIPRCELGCFPTWGLTATVTVDEWQGAVNVVGVIFWAAPREDFKEGVQ